MADDREAVLLSEQLRAAPVFAALAEPERVALARAGTRRRLARGAVLYRQGEAGASLAVVLTGALDVVRHAEDGEEVALRRLAPGATIGLSPALGAAHSADVVAAASSEVLVIPAAALRALVRREPDVLVRALLQFAAWVSALSDEVEALRTTDIAARTRRKLAELAGREREVRLTHEELAARVGASRANVSRALKQLEREGTLRLQRGRIVLLRSLAW